MSKCVWIINQYGSTPDTGVGGRHFYLARELAKKGFNVYLIASASHHLLRNKPKLNGRFKIEPVDGFNMVWVNMPGYLEAHSKQRALNWFIFPWRIQKLSKIIPCKPDVVLSSSPSLISFLGAEKLAKKFKSRLVFEVRDIWPLSLVELGGFSVKHPFIAFMQWLEDKAYRNSQAVISNLKNSVEHMVARGMERKKFTWIPNGFSLDEVSQNIPLSSIAANQLPENKFIVGYTGTIGVANALDTFIDAAEQLQDYCDNIAFVLVGSGKEKHTLQTQVNTKSLSNVYFIDPIPKVEIQAMLSRFDICYIGLTKDPLFRFGVSPNKLFDYLYSGKPIIYGIDSGDYKPIEEAGAGIQVPAQDPEQLANAILKIYQMPVEQKENLGLNGRKVAIEQYEYRQLAEKLAKVLFDQ